MPFSAVIITKNEAHIIGQTLQALQSVTDDIIIVDSGSTDETLAICVQFNARVIQTAWHGYGINKNMGIDAAKYDWILSLDADEVVDDVLQQSLQKLIFKEKNTVYNIRFKTFFCNRWIKHGEWAGDEHIRLFNREMVRWNEALVHENLQIPANAITITLKGFIKHFTVNSLEEYINKTLVYARLNAQKYHQQGKKASWIKLRLSPQFSFIYYYLLRLGFLDGWEGYLIAKTNAWYTFLKYAYLKEINQQDNFLGK